MDHLGVLGQEGERLARAAAADLGAPVPSCPGWSATDLVVHLGEVSLTAGLAAGIDRD